MKIFAINHPEGGQQLTTAQLVAALNTEHPELAAAIRGEGATAERSRVLGILAMAKNDGDRTIAMACAEDAACTKGDAAEKILAARDANPAAPAPEAPAAVAMGAAHLAAQRRIEEGLPKPGAVAKPGAEDVTAQDEEKEIQAILATGN